MRFVCPACKGALLGEYECPSCELSFPVIHGIPDFRLYPDPYIGIEADREKAAGLFAASRTRSFPQMLDYYYAITEEDPGDLAARWTAHSLAEPEIAAFLLARAGLNHGRRLLDVGCSTGGLLIAAHSGFTTVTGVDVALRWLMIGAVRLREAAVPRRLVCANAEALPFADAGFDVITSVDTVEHLRNAGEAFGETWRVAAGGARAVWVTNNRWAPVPEPQVHLWGVGWLPRAYQPGYVAWRRRDLHRYQIRMRSAPEMTRLARAAGFETSGTEAAPLIAPHRPSWSAMLAIYNRLRGVPLLPLVAPRLWTRARKLTSEPETVPNS